MDTRKREEEKARRRGQVYNWEIATYGKIWYDKDVHDLRYVEIEFSAIVFNDALTSEVALSCEPTVSPLNDNQINFRISFDESDDEDYTIIYDKNSFSYKIISVNNLKTDSKNSNDKVNMPSFSSSEPTVTLNHDKKVDFETLLSECDGEEQNVIYFNDLFPFNVIFPNDLKSDKDNNDDKINIKQSSRDISVIPFPDVINTDVGTYAQGSHTAYPGFGIRQPPWKEIDNVDEVLIIWNLMCIVEAFSTHILAHEIIMENHTEQISGEFLILIL
ncbi:hypothetical protein Tco_0162899 [Tanacetum coccineum]